MEQLILQLVMGTCLFGGCAIVAIIFCRSQRDINRDDYDQINAEAIDRDRADHLKRRGM